MSLRVEGDINRIAARFRAMEARTNNLRAAWPKVQLVVSNLENQQFGTQGARLGTPWQPLSPSYGAWKMAKGGLPTPLILTGSLLDSFTGKGRYALTGPKYWKANRASFGSRHPLARLHQKGSKQGLIPARPMLVATPEMKHKITDIVQDHIMGRL